MRILPFLIGMVCLGCFTAGWMSLGAFASATVIRVPIDAFLPDLLFYIGVVLFAEMLCVGFFVWMPHAPPTR